MTDSNGVSAFTLTFEAQPPGTNVPLEFWVLKDDIQATTRDSFRIWW
jgi:hypothetical protein